MQNIEYGRRQIITLFTALMIGAFTIGLDLFVVIGALDKMANTLEIKEHNSGWIITTYALCYAVAAPICAFLFRDFNRFALLTASIGAFVFGNLMCGIADDFNQVIIGRIISALGAAAFTPTATVLASEIFRPERKGFALSLMYGGMTLSQAIGVPLTTYIAERFNWRYSFYLIVFFGCLSFILLLKVLVRFPSAQSKANQYSSKSKPPLVIIGLLLVTFLIVLSEFTVYSYVSFFITGKIYGELPALPIVLLAYGIGAVLGNIATGLFTDRFGPTAVLISSTSLQTFLLLLLIFYRDQGFPLVIIGLAWGVTSYMYLVPIQHRLLSHAGSASNFILSINSSLIYLGIASGAYLGGAILETSNIQRLALISGCIGALAILASVQFMRSNDFVGVAND